MIVGAGVARVTGYTTIIGAATGILIFVSINLIWITVEDLLWRLERKKRNRYK